MKAFNFQRVIADAARYDPTDYETMVPLDPEYRKRFPHAPKQLPAAMLFNYYRKMRKITEWVREERAWRAWEYRHDNPRAIYRYNTAYEWGHKDIRRAILKRYAKNHKEALREYNHKYEAEHRERRNAYRRDYNHWYPEKKAEIQARYVATHRDQINARRRERYHEQQAALKARQEASHAED